MSTLPTHAGSLVRVQLRPRATALWALEDQGLVSIQGTEVEGEVGITGAVAVTEVWVGEAVPAPAVFS